MLSTGQQGDAVELGPLGEMWDGRMRLLEPAYWPPLMMRLGLQMSFAHAI